MISELKRFDLKVLNQVRCELVDPSYSMFKLFDIYEIGIDGISNNEYNCGYSYKKFHIMNQGILTYLKARIKIIKYLD
ncbi:hypothetical protein LCGC14_0949410 [marine sediment metagenome]|uniref:Uncharacterized protein n=1 Tax=marine sediment metagenome TaxID=412755 RepID=A0A0F9NHT4_9ZZZZ|nr:MAG: hypothetical protein Lokiarch_47190 [Candidatus Lokiarchaeum sp. GC14_75]